MVSSIYDETNHTKITGWTLKQAGSGAITVPSGQTLVYFYQPSTRQSVIKALVNSTSADVQTSGVSTGQYYALVSAPNNNFFIGLRDQDNKEIFQMQLWSHASSSIAFPYTTYFYDLTYDINSIIN